MGLKKNRSSIVANESGQGMLEYILLIFIIVGVFLGISRGMVKIGLAERMMRPIREDFAYAYRHGHPEARGYEDGGPKKHPRALQGAGSGRMYIEVPK
ncbi:MAG: hypothetical protein JNL01_11270 [Bdellovibrionales bacterium]|nr:hypothetical protein [Bdellovibrionales bacterium]